MKSYTEVKALLGTESFEAKAPESPIKVKDGKSCRLNAAVLSDLHVSEKIAEQTKNAYLSLDDLAFAQNRIDVLTFAGDLTNNGKENEYRLLSEKLNKIKTVDNIVPVTGNHDIRFGAFSSTLKNFAEFCSDVNSNLKVPGLWYSNDANGYTFIVLGSVKRRFEEATLSKEELIWLDKKLTANDSKNKPVFVMLHQPLKLTHNLPNSWDMPGTKAGSVGKESDMLEFVLGMHKNVFLITGHLHRGFNQFTFEEHSDIHCISVPAIGLYNKDSDYSTPGLGIMIEIYDDEVIFRPRNFIEGRYIPKLETTYTIE